MASHGCPATAFRDGKTHVTGTHEKKWCAGTWNYPLSTVFNEEHKIQCESHYVDPVLPVPSGYAFDCTGECAPCVYTTNDDGNYICKIDNALKTTGCAGTPSHPATTTRTRLMGSLGAGDNSYCWTALDGYDGDTPKDKCESYFVDPVDPDIPDTYRGCLLYTSPSPRDS